jgi:hypothetical protein
VFNYPVEKHILRFYIYKFLGLENNPITIEAYNKLEARKKLLYFLEKNPDLNLGSVVDESVTLPILYETKKDINGTEYVWVGNMTQSNWMPLEEFEKLNI